jgi:hypothetical protein
MNANANILSLTQSLLKTCESDGRSIKLFVKKAPCKKALGLLLIHLGLGKDEIVKRLTTTGKVSHGDYMTLKHRLTQAIREELGSTKKLFVLGDSVSTVTLRQVLLVIVDLLGCKRMHCNNVDQIMQCVVNNCSSMMVICMDLAVDLYTKVPCYKGLEIPCRKEMVVFKKQVETIHQKISNKKRLTKKELDDVEHTIQILTSMMSTT